MMKSMTGFGRCEVSEGQRKFTVELKGVNHRYLDVNIRMPKKLNFFDASTQPPAAPMPYTSTATRARPH